MKAECTVGRRQVDKFQRVDPLRGLYILKRYIMRA
ncbi:hypothetical protein BMW23_0523 [Bodo saltans virus]|uniref:Uncharacterized protein n=1 Tax=Bodo saltans virus TaxID=2024608 RepID=A0A2H4UUG7_9VIRU|nr:hypothetical protein QJ851_gp0507 [Bodo saltans virus]ATZ80570.1 hypothetical protein BMW23_0523 [Bodo saltans virus]